MARERKGTLVWRKKGWCARVTVTVDGEPDKKWYPLGTDNRAGAKRKLARLVAKLEKEGAPAPSEAAGDDTVSEYAKAHFETRQIQGIASVRDERSYFKSYVEKEIGALAVTAVRSAHIRAVLEAAVGKGLAKNTIVHLRSLMHRIFKAAWQDELIGDNPVARVGVPSMHETTKERCILTDAEIAKYLACDDVDLELRLMSLVARVEGGMRTSDVNRWDWSMLDRVHFAECFVPRSKTGKPQRLEVPGVLRPLLRERWERAGRLEGGPVFPVRRGERAGEFRAERGISYAAALRRDLLRAGVKRHKCDRPANGPTPKRGEACCVNMVHDPLFTETKTTLPVDFHSFRRAFNTALAEAGVNSQRAMKLAHHSDEKVHMRYVMNTAEMRRIPEAAVPNLPLRLLTQKTPVVSDASDDPSFSSSHLRDLNSRPTVYESGAQATSSDFDSLSPDVVRDAKSSESGVVGGPCLSAVSHGRPWLLVLAELGPGLCKAALKLPSGALAALASRA